MFENIQWNKLKVKYSRILSNILSWIFLLFNKKSIQIFIDRGQHCLVNDIYCYVYACWWTHYSVVLTPYECAKNFLSKYFGFIPFAPNFIMCQRVFVSKMQCKHVYVSFDFAFVCCVLSAQLYAARKSDIFSYSLIYGM